MWRVQPESLVNLFKMLKLCTNRIFPSAEFSHARAADADSSGRRLCRPRIHPEPAAVRHPVLSTALLLLGECFSEDWFVTEFVSDACSRTSAPLKQLARYWRVLVSDHVLALSSLCVAWFSSFRPGFQKR